MAFTEQERQRIIDAIQKKAPTFLNCPLCGQNHWILQDGFIVPILQDSASQTRLSGPSLPSIAITCGNCGNTHILNALALGLQDLVKGAKTESQAKAA